MAAAVKRVPGVEPDPQRIGQYLVACRTITLDNSYPTGGYAIAPGAFGLQDIFFFDVTALAGGYDAEWDYTNNKLIVRGGAASGAAAAEVSNATDLSAVTPMRVMVWGR